MDLTIIQSLILGVTQGVTEFIPVSSSGHLALVSHFLELNEGNLVPFFVALHIGTFFAVLIYFWRDWLNLLGLRDDMDVYRANPYMLRCIIIATAPAVLVGFFFLRHLDVLVGSPLFIAVMLLIGGLLLYLSDRYGRSECDLRDIGMMEALLIGIAQIFALIPGISRSGITIAMARALHLDRVSAARFSFLLSTPIIAGAGLSQIHIFSFAATNFVFWLGVAASFVSAYCAITYFLKLMQRMSYAPFFWYSVFLVALFLIFR